MFSFDSQSSPVSAAHQRSWETTGVFAGFADVGPSSSSVPASWTTIVSGVNVPERFPTHSVDSSAFFSHPVAYVRL